MKRKPIVYIALPVLNESENLSLLMKYLVRQDAPEFHLVVCVNNFEHWWDDPDKQVWCGDNQKSLEYLQRVTTMNITLIDKSSKGKGWPEKKGGVGSARKTAMDFISERADDYDLIVSMDADTRYPENYLTAVCGQFNSKPDLFGLALPYYHKLAGNGTDRLILRYEIYMRYYLLNMLRIKNPYAFTALGSAMAFPVWAYKKTGGLTPVKSGEDFYFLQKLAKAGKVGLWADTVAYPSSRFSERVIFGTGPALLKGQRGHWDNYPFYHYSSFDKVGQTFALFPGLFKKDFESPMDDFLKNRFNLDDLWGILRKNYKDPENFIRACTGKTDALRILQFLRADYKKQDGGSGKVLAEYLDRFWKGRLPEQVKMELSELDFERTTISGLNVIRDFLFHEEMLMRKKFDALR